MRLKEEASPVNNSISRLQLSHLTIYGTETELDRFVYPSIWPYCAPVGGGSEKSAYSSFQALREVKKASVCSYDEFQNSHAI